MTLLLQDTLVISPKTVNEIKKEIEDLKGATDCADVVQDKAALDAYDTSKLTDNAIVKVLQDESKNGAETYYRYSKSSNSFTFIGKLGPYYTKSEDDTLLAGKVDKTTTAYRLYGTSSNGSQTTLTYDSVANANTIAIRDDNGQVYIAQTPTADGHAASKKYVDDADSGKVDKTTGTYKIYGTGNTGAQTTYTLSYTDATGYTIAQRSSDGNIVIGTTPTQNTHAASKGYVDTQDALKQNKATVTASDTTTLSVTLADNTIFNNTSAGLTTLTITNPTTPTVDFASQVNFTSGSTATVVTASNIIWMGDNVSEIAGFVPRTNCRYTIDFVYDGSNIRGYIQGVSL